MPYPLKCRTIMAVLFKRTKLVNVNEVYNRLIIMDKWINGEQVVAEAA